MTYKELTTAAGKGVATMFHDADAELYKRIFGDATQNDLDRRAAALYANRIVFDGVDVDTAALLIGTFVRLNAERWTRQFAALYSDYDVLRDYTQRRTKTGTDTDTTNGKDTELRATKPFNAGDFDDGERQTNETANNTTREYNTVETVDGTNSPAQRSINAEIALRRTKYEQAVLQELINELCLSLYD